MIDRERRHSTRRGMRTEIPTYRAGWWEIASVVAAILFLAAWIISRFI